MVEFWVPREMELSLVGVNFTTSQCVPNTDGTTCRVQETSLPYTFYIDHRSPGSERSMSGRHTATLPANGRDYVEPLPLCELLTVG